MSSGQRKATALLTTNAQRFVAIERWLRSGGGEFAQLRGLLNVSAATVKRDLQAMRGELGAPIAYDALADRYHLADDWKGVRACLLEQFTP
jgi:predicted DNA-binding transcriptional regulator YafY